MSHRYPIVFSPDYDITFMGIEKMHPFDSCKYGRVVNFLQEKGLLTDENSWHSPVEVTDEELLEVHTPAYIESLKSSANVASVTELSMLRMIPNLLLRKFLLRPMKLATGGTWLAAQLAVDHGWAINLAGGYHHARADFGHGFCVYADIPLSAYRLLKIHPDWKIMVVDLDAHQGDGFERIFKNDTRFVTFDMYNGNIFPNDWFARTFITYDHPLPVGMDTVPYLNLLQKELPKALDEAQPDFIFYNAGTDVFASDPLGGLGVSREGIMVRDKTVFEEAKKRNIPVAMVLSGGYTQESASIIADSIAFVHKQLGWGNTSEETVIS